MKPTQLTQGPDSARTRTHRSLKLKGVRSSLRPSIDRPCAAIYVHTCVCIQKQQRILAPAHMIPPVTSSFTSESTSLTVFCPVRNKEVLDRAIAKMSVVTEPAFWKAFLRQKQ